jgi:hypothetical protein
MAEIISINEHKQRLWDAFVAAQKQAQQSGLISDGIAAGHAWRRWLDLYMTDEQREFLGRRSA